LHVVLLLFDERNKKLVEGVKNDDDDISIWQKIQQQTRGRRSKQTHHSSAKTNIIDVHPVQ